MFNSLGSKGGEPNVLVTSNNFKLMDDFAMSELTLTNVMTLHHQIK